MQNLLWLYQESVMTLQGVGHDSARSPSWLCDESIMALRGVCHCSESSPSGWDIASTGRNRSQQVTDFS